MCIKNMRLIFIILILLTFSGSGFCSTELIATEILQLKMNRIYFASGEEENIFRDCSFFLIKANDTLLTGQIEASYPGLSYSYLEESLFDKFDTDSCLALIQPAQIDSLTPINIGMLKSIPYGSPSNFPGLTSVTTTNDSASSQKYSKSIRTPAPFYAALIPNISKAVNNKGLLTTSIYYRFNEKRLTAIFEGDQTVPYNCLFPAADTCRRYYDFNPDHGRNLLKFMDKKPKKLFLSIGNSTLEKLGLYFADILSRDRIRLKFTGDDSKADMYIKFIPLSENNKDSSLIYILDLLQNDWADNININSTITGIKNYLESAKSANSKERQVYYFNRTERALIEDLGVFPLLRPSLFFISAENLKGTAFDNNGRLDMSNLRKIVLPQKPAGANR